MQHAAAGDSIVVDHSSAVCQPSVCTMQPLPGNRLHESIWHGLSGSNMPVQVAGLQQTEPRLWRSECVTFSLCSLSVGSPACLNILVLDGGHLMYTH